MRYLPNGAWMQQADRRTIDEIGIPSIVLMEQAALQTVEAILRTEWDCHKTLVVCGSGNNGGDGFAIARLMKQRGYQVTVLFAGSEHSMSEECSIQAAISRNLNIPIITDLAETADPAYTVVIDAIFGVGLNREVGGKYRELISKLNDLPARKVAVDIPSGISADTGKILGVAFRADLTVTFQCEKLGTVLYPGKTYAGHVEVAEIGIETSWMNSIQEICYTLEPRDIRQMLPKRRPDSHKGSYGKVLMITGSEGMAGAAFLSAKAAYISGAGLVRIYTPEANRMVLQQLLPEAIVTTYHAYDEGQVASLLEWADVVCIGCGLGQSQTALAILQQTIQTCTVPCVVDADGINLLSWCRDLLRLTDTPVVLTPHIKEMAGLMGCSVSEVLEDRFLKLTQFTARYPAICVLKDARTIVGERTRQTFVNTAGNQAMSKAGAGDVLAGVITGLLAGGTPPYEAAVLGVYVHANGGDLARNLSGSYSVLAEDLITGVASCIKRAEEEEL